MKINTDWDDASTSQGTTKLVISIMSEYVYLVQENEVCGRGEEDVGGSDGGRSKEEAQPSIPATRST